MLFPNFRYEKEIKGCNGNLIKVLCQNLTLKKNVLLTNINYIRQRVFSEIRIYYIYTIIRKKKSVVFLIDWIHLKIMF